MPGIHTVKSDVSDPAAIAALYEHKKTMLLPSRQVLGFRGGISDDMALRTFGRFHLDLFGG
jgi:hypothetical protein